MKLDMAILAGPESKQFLVELTRQIDRLERITNHFNGAKNPVEAEETPEVDDDEDDDEEEVVPAPKAVKKSKAPPAPKSFDEDDADEEETVEAAESEDDEDEEAAAPAVSDDDDDEDEGFTEPAPKAKKGAKAAKKLTMDDVNDACKERARGEGGRDAVLKILQKKFKTKTVRSLKPEQFQSCIEAMKV